MLFIYLNVGIQMTKCRCVWTVQDKRCFCQITSRWVEKNILKCNLSSKFSVLHSSILFLNPHRRRVVCVCVCVLNGSPRSAWKISIKDTRENGQYTVRSHPLIGARYHPPFCENKILILTTSHARPVCDWLSIHHQIQNYVNPSFQ